MGRPLPDPDVPHFDPVLNRWVRYWGVQLMIFPGMDAIPFELGIPYILAIHDLQHRLQPEFPEVSSDGEWEWREYFYRNGARYATLLVADSEVGKEDILSSYGSYGLTSDRICVLPYLPASYLKVDVTEAEQQRVRANHRLPERYLFCPAQFFRHKNHGRIVRALALLREGHGLRVPLVCSGLYLDRLRQPVFEEVKELVQRLGLEEQVRLLKYVPERDMSGLYAGADALVFPTFFGPTNIPPLEAWSFGCPVLTSDSRGIREQMGDAAVLVDPHSVESIAAGIHRLWTDPNLRSKLVARGRARLASYTPADYQDRLRAILEEAKQRVRGGRVPKLPVPPAS